MREIKPRLQNRRGKTMFRMKSTADEVQEYSNSEREIRRLKERIRKEKLSKGQKCLYEIELDG